MFQKSIPTPKLVCFYFFIQLQKQIELRNYDDIC